MDREQAPVALFIAALVPGLYTWFHPEGFGFGHGFEMAAIAKNLAATGIYGNPFEPAITGPTAALPPLYPVFLASLIKIFHEPMCGAVALLINIFVNAIIAAMLPRVSKTIYGDDLPGIFAGAMWVFTMRLMPQWDTSFTIAGLLLFCLAARPWTAGLVAGLLSLLNPLAVVIVAVWTAWRRNLRFAATFVLMLMVCNLPWVARNYGIWHRLVVRTNFGTTLYSSNNDCAQASLLQNGRTGCFQKTHLVQSSDELALFQRIGEVEYEHRRTIDAVAWIRTHPTRFRELTLERIFQFWFPEPEQSPFTVYATWLVTLVSIPGVVLMARRKAAALWPFAAIWLIYPLTYYVMVSCDRYRYPILWTSLLPAGYWLASLLRDTLRKYEPARFSGIPECAGAAGATSELGADLRK